MFFKFWVSRIDRIVRFIDCRRRRCVERNLSCGGAGSCCAIVNIIIDFSSTAYFFFFFFNAEGQRLIKINCNKREKKMRGFFLTCYCLLNLCAWELCFWLVLDHEIWVCVIKINYNEYIFVYELETLFEVCWNIYM